MQNDTEGEERVPPARAWEGRWDTAPGILIVPDHPGVELDGEAVGDAVVADAAGVEAEFGGTLGVIYSRSWLPTYAD